MTYIIAEAGTWHKGNLERAKNLVDTAADCGADAIKFQIFVPNDLLFCPLEGDGERWKFWGQSCMTFEKWVIAAAHAKKRGIDFLASTFQPTSLEWLKTLNTRYIKVASRAAEVFPYDSIDGPFLISAGMISGEQSHKISMKLAMLGRDAKFLQCVSEYPTPLNKAGWTKYDGLSDHSGKVWPAIDAMARGAEFIEVHFTDSFDPDWPDAKVSLLPGELSQICEARDVFAQMRQD